MESAGPYASLHLAPDRQPHQHPTTQFFTGRMPFLPPNQQRQSTVFSIIYLIIFNRCASVLWYCRLGVRKSIRPVKIEWWSVGVVICLERGADCLHMVQLMPLHPKTPSSHAWLKSRLVLPFWYRLTQAVLEKNRCSSSSRVSMNQCSALVKNYRICWNQVLLPTCPCSCQLAYSD